MRFVATGPLPPIGHALLGRIAPVETAPAHDEASLLKLLEDTIGLVVRGDARVSARLIQSAPALKVIGRTGVGYDNVDVPAATARRIPVVITPGANAVGVAEATLAALLALTKRVLSLDRATRGGNSAARNHTVIGGLAGCTRGLVGLGGIGREVARRARVFDVVLLAARSPRHVRSRERKRCGALRTRCPVLPVRHRLAACGTLARHCRPRQRQNVGPDEARLDPAQLRARRLCSRASTSFTQRSCRGSWLVRPSTSSRRNRPMFPIHCSPTRTFCSARMQRGFPRVRSNRRR